MKVAVDPRDGALSAEEYNNTDKDQKRLGIYQEYFPPQATFLKLLELGIDKGGSLEMWRDWFPNATIVGLDIDLSRVRRMKPDIIYCQGDQGDIPLLRKITNSYAPDGWDIIIDDASHRGDLTRLSYTILFPYLKIRGLYIIEDWGTAYMDDLAYDGELYQGKNHLAGMAGFIKELMDVCAMPRIYGVPSSIERLVVAPGLAIVRKA